MDSALKLSRQYERRAKFMKKFLFFRDKYVMVCLNLDKIIIFHKKMIYNIFIYFLEYTSNRFN